MFANKITDLVIVRAVGGLFDACVLFLVADLNADDGVHVETGELASLNDRHRNLKNNVNYKIEIFFVVNQ